MESAEMTLRALSLYFLLYILFFTSCLREKSENVDYENKNQKFESNQESYQKESIVIVKGIDCEGFSESMKEFIHVIEADNYQVRYSENSENLVFESRGNSKASEKNITFPKTQFNRIYVKRKNKIEGLEDNWYPRFSVAEICFLNNENAEIAKKEIIHIIEDSDIINEKIYDYIIQNGSKLIYVSCQAKIFESYSLGYKKQIESIVDKYK